MVLFPHMKNEVNEKEVTTTTLDEVNEKEVTTTTLEKLARALGVPTADLIEDVPDTEKP